MKRESEGIKSFTAPQFENPLSKSLHIKRQRIRAGISAFRSTFGDGVHKEERLAEKCGVFGVYGTPRAAQLTLSGLHDLQHRGQGSSGIAASNGTNITYHKANGLVVQVFNNYDMRQLSGGIAIGHTRYATSQGGGVQHAQPIVVEDVGIALSHNGNISSTEKLKDFLRSKKVNHQHLSDSRMIAKAVAVHVREGATLPQAIKETFPILTGAFAILAMDKDTLVAFRDTCGIRPLSIGTLGKKSQGGFVFSSETCAFPPINASYLGDVRPGEMIAINKDGMHSEQCCEQGTQKLDIFEFIYFARPDSMLLDRRVYMVRRNLGMELAKEHPLVVDVVIPVPQTAIPAAKGYSDGTGIPNEHGLIKVRDRRTFIDPEQAREQGIKMKLAVIPEVIRGKRIAVVDDSIVRGTTSQEIVQMLKHAGAKEVHFLVTSPPIMYPDFYGINIPNQNELIAAQKTPREIRDFLGADSLHYLSYEGLIRATGLPAHLFSAPCFTGEYPIDIGDHAKEIVYP